MEKIFTFISKKQKLLLMVLLFSIHIIFLYCSVLVGQTGLDFYYFYNDTTAFWYGKQTYNGYGFIYLNYFYVLFFWVIFFPILLAVIIHILITELMFYYILQNIDSPEKQWWLYANLVIFLFWSATMNVNTYIIFSFFVYQKNREKWYIPIILFLAFYKITTIPVFFVIFLINLLYEKKFRLKQIIPFLFLFIITCISFIGSIHLILNSNSKLGKYRFLLCIHPSHAIWLTFPFYLILNYIHVNEKTLKTLSVCIFIWLFIWMIILYAILDFKAFLLFIDFFHQVFAFY